MSSGSLCVWGQRRMAAGPSVCRVNRRVSAVVIPVLKPHRRKTDGAG